MLTLYHAWDSFQSFKVRFCLEELQINWQGHTLLLTKLDHLRPSFLRINPEGLVPALRSPQGLVFESSVINEYLNEEFAARALSPDTPFDCARMRGWCRYQDTVVHQAIRPPTFNLYIKNRVKAEPQGEFDSLIANHPDPIRANAYKDAVSAPPNHADIRKSLLDIQKIITKVNGAVADYGFLVGDRFSLADIAMGALVERLDALGLEALWQSSQAASEWAEMIRNRPAYQSASRHIESLSFVDRALASALVNEIL